MARWAVPEILADMKRKRPACTGGGTAMEECSDAYVFTTHMEPGIRGCDINTLVWQKADGTRTITISNDGTRPWGGRPKVSCDFLLPDDADAYRPTFRHVYYKNGVVKTTVPKFKC